MMEVNGINKSIGRSVEIVLSVDRGEKVLVILTAFALNVTGRFVYDLLAKMEMSLQTKSFFGQN